jgi:hypothetical protein
MSESERLSSILCGEECPEEKSRVTKPSPIYLGNTEVESLNFFDSLSNTKSNSSEKSPNSEAEMLRNKENRLNGFFDFDGLSMNASPSETLSEKDDRTLNNSEYTTHSHSNTRVFSNKLEGGERNELELNTNYKKDETEEIHRLKDNASSTYVDLKGTSDFNNKPSPHNIDLPFLAQPDSQFQSSPEETHQNGSNIPPNPLFGFPYENLNNSNEGNGTNVNMGMGNMHMGMDMGISPQMMEMYMRNQMSSFHSMYQSKLKKQITREKCLNRKTKVIEKKKKRAVAKESYEERNMSKKQWQLIRNRVSAQESRDRKKQERHKLLRENADFEQENKQLKERLQLKMSELNLCYKVVDQLSDRSKKEFKTLHKKLSSPFTQNNTVLAMAPKLNMKNPLLFGTFVLGCIALIAFAAPFTEIEQPVLPTFNSVNTNARILSSDSHSSSNEIQMEEDEEFFSSETALLPYSEMQYFNFFSFF